MPERTYTPSTSSGYRYGFNGMEQDSDIALDNYDFGARIYDGRLGRWLSVDPLQSKYPMLSPYNYVANCPINAVDPDGRLIIFINGLRYNEGAADQGRNQAIPGSKITAMPGIYRELEAGVLRNYWRDGLGETNTFGENVDMVKEFQKAIGDYRAVFVSGSAEHKSQAGQLDIISRTIVSSRYYDGVEKAKQFHKMVQDGLIKIDKDETIKIITHSQGGAHGEGFARQLMSYKDENGNATYNIEVIYNITPHQPTDITAIEGVRNVQYSHPSDAVVASSNNDKLQDWQPINLFNGGSKHGKMKGTVEFVERDIMGGIGQPPCESATGNRCGHNVTDNKNFIFKIPRGQSGNVSPRKDKPQ